MRLPIFIAAAGIAASSISGVTASFADTKPEIDVNVRETLKQFDGLNSRNAHLLSTAAGTLVFPRVTKGGLGVAGEYGEGVLRVGDRTVVGFVFGEKGLMADLSLEGSKINKIDR
jgi:lipid-binding SYLF domain-containing protein